MTRTSLFIVAALALGCTSQSPQPKQQDTPAKQPAFDNKAAKADTKKATPEKPKPPRRRVKEIPPPDDVGAPPPDAKKTESGLAYKIETEGDGKDEIGPNDSVKVNFTAWRTSGETHETTDGRPARKLQLARVSDGLREGLQLLKVGAKAKFWIPEGMAYTERQRKEGMLVYQVELVELTKAPPVPEDVKAPPGDAKKTASGLAYKVLKRGSGRKKPKKWDRVKVHYSGWTTDGKMFDSSLTRGREAQFPLNKVIPGWTEGLQLMVVGEKTRFWIPEEQAYKGQRGKPQGMLVFDVELFEITEMPEPPKAPEDVKAPPEDAQKTASGLAYKVLKKGKGKEHPTASSQVSVHYSGWTTDGNMFDSSVTRGQPATFPLKGVIKGWTEGLQLMVEGEKTRFWIPKELAYNDRKGKPQGMLVFDVELLEIK